MDPAQIAAAIALAQLLFKGGAAVIEMLRNQDISDEQKETIRVMSEEATAGIKAATPIPKPKPLAGFVG